MTTTYSIHTPHSVKQWHLESLGLLAEGRESLNQNQTAEILKTRFSTWTPIENKSLNNQLFQERVRLISHWFDLWTDKQRKQFLHGILIKCNRSQMKFAERWFIENIPVTKVDFTTVLPRFISLYIFSFLNAKDLCASAQVNWHWKFLTEQDCLWMPKCITFGWFLPYLPEKNEYSAWKQYYIACATDLGYLTPREVAESHGTLIEPKMKNEDQEESLHEKCLQKIMRERLALHKKELFKARPPWISGTRSSGFYRSGFQPNLSQTIHDQARSATALFLMKKRMLSPSEKLFKQISEEAKPLPRVGLEAGKLPKRHCWTVSRRDANRMHALQPHLVLISSHIPAYEMVVDSVKPGVVPVVYDHSGTTLESLLYYVGKALDGQTAKSIGIVSDGDSRGINLLQGCRISTKNLCKPEVREFWEKLSCVMLEEDGCIDAFVPLAASEAGMEVLSQLSHLTGMLFRTPTGIATGSYQHILSEWFGNQKDSPAPPSLYFTEVKLQLWLRFTELLEDVLKAVRKKLRPYFCDLQKNMTGKIFGQIMFDAMSWSDVQDNQRIAQVLVEGLAEFSRGNYENPYEFLSCFLMRKYKKNEELRSQVSLTASNPEASLDVSVKSGKLYEETVEKRKRFARELLLSESNYLHMLEIVHDVYVKPLKAALASNRAILSHISVQTIFSDILNILQLNRWFLDELTQRLNEWNPAQKLGDLFIQFGQQLQTYTNFFNNYAVILKTIDKCRETLPLFRAFLKRHDKTIITTMRSLQELLLCPSKRIEEYIMLLYALKLHTAPEHTDREELTTAIKQMKQYKDYLDQLKLNVGREDQILTTQRLIQGSPLLKANRYLIRMQDVAQLNCLSERISMPFRLFEHIHDLSLFLFNDILVISRRKISYKPFERISNVTYQFLAMVTLHQLLVEDIPDSKYIKNAFLLQGTRCQMICSTEDDNKLIWLSALHRAISCSIEDNVKRS
ncbi:epithelial cell-transforming sequence 2 oncogene-like isoform X2 [Rhineura floridana]|uniref:epithelial cell-transforming sequence 2 oncogene-like isoform X2 n=1 Tax=Rhineura floridana TaxID=261503 RepID=UPI002AC82123|nr:epithelial cell-transforming sequence 2 oncogene-like isoform X2 [Rhineura floridana]